MIFILAAVVLLLVLVFYGGMPVAVKRSAVFVGGLSGRNACEASFTACHGTIFRVLRFREARSYSFCLSGRTQKGNVAVQVLDRQRKAVLSLDAARPTGILSAQKGQFYFLSIRFTEASGDFRLEWS